MSRPRRIYISGPMSGLTADEVARRFGQAERRLRAEGWQRIENPARYLVSRHPWLYRLMGYRLTLCYDLLRLSRCTDILMLRGYVASPGALTEEHAAKAFGLTLHFEGYNGEIFQEPSTAKRPRMVF